MFSTSSPSRTPSPQGRWREIRPQPCHQRWNFLSSVVSDHAGRLRGNCSTPPYSLPSTPGLSRSQAEGSDKIHLELGCSSFNLPTSTHLQVWAQTTWSGLDGVGGRERVGASFLPSLSSARALKKWLWLKIGTFSQLPLLPSILNSLLPIQVSTVYPLIAGSHCASHCSSPSLCFFIFKMG